MSHSQKIIVSNRAEELYKVLIQNLFSCPHPFSQRIIIVPSPAMKTWLTIRMAEDPSLKICMGVRFYYLEEGLNYIQTHYLQNVKEEYLPSTLEISLKIETELRKLFLFSTKEAFPDYWLPIFNYLKLEKNKISKKGEKRLISLSDKIASLFKIYGDYGKGLIDELEKSFSTCWQADLWKKVFTNWSYPYKAYTQNFSFNSLNKTSIHLFAISYLSPIQMNFLEKLSAGLEVFRYYLSPSALFWSDICSDRQKNYIQKFWSEKKVPESQESDLEELLRDRNQLLANFGKLGKEVCKELEDAPNVEERYVVNQSISTLEAYSSFYFDDYLIDPLDLRPTILSAVQTDMLLLRNPEKEKVIDFEEDTSVQVHIAPSKLREVEILYNSLMTLFDKHKADKIPLKPSDILVLTPDMLEYEPYIKAVFQRVDSQLNCQIMDLKIPSKSSLIQAFLHLLSIAESRWDCKAVLHLIEFASFRQQHEISLQEALKIKEWIRKAGITWGVDAAQREEILLKEHCEKGMIDRKEDGTFEDGISKLIGSLGMIDESEDLKNSIGQETVSLNFSESETLGKFTKILRALKDDLTLLIDGTELTIKEWCDYLHCLLESYFKVEEGDYQTLKDKIDQIKGLCRWIPGEKFPFLTVKKRLEQLLDKQEVCYRENHVQAVKFCSMLPMRAIPSKVIALLGMGESIFPKQDYNFSLNLLKNREDVDFCPNQIDYDRYLFLEILLSARNYLLISYSATNIESGALEGMSLLVEELLSYLDSAYILKGEKPSVFCVKKHPYHSFHYSYFSENTLSKNYFKNQYKESIAFYRGIKKEPFIFIKEFTHNCVKEKEITIGSEVLTTLLRNPLQLYFNQKLGIYLNKNKVFDTEENFTLSSLQEALIKKVSIRVPSKKIVGLVQSQSKYPTGFFGEIARDKTEKESLKIFNNLKALGVDVKDIFSIHLSENCEHCEKDNQGNRVIPAIELKVGESKVKIIGTLKDVCKEGLIVYAGDKIKDLIKQWGNYLLLGFLIDKYDLKIKLQMILIKEDQKVKLGIPGNPEELLKELIELYFISSQNPSPLIPEWIAAIIEDDSEKLKDEMDKMFKNPSQPCYNDYLNRIYSLNKTPDADKIMDDWQNIAEKILGKPYYHWGFGKKESKEKVKSE